MVVSAEDGRGGEGVDRAFDEMSDPICRVRAASVDFAVFCVLCYLCVWHTFVILSVCICQVKSSCLFRISQFSLDFAFGHSRYIVYLYRTTTYQQLQYNRCSTSTKCFGKVYIVDGV